MLQLTLTVYGIETKDRRYLNAKFFHLLQLTLTVYGIETRCYVRLNLFHLFVATDTYRLRCGIPLYEREVFLLSKNCAEPPP